MRKRPIGPERSQALLLQHPEEDHRQAEQRTVEYELRRIEPLLRRQLQQRPHRREAQPGPDPAEDAAGYMLMVMRSGVLRHDGLPRQLAICRSVRPGGLFAEATDLVFLISLEVALKPF